MAAAFLLMGAYSQVNAQENGDLRLVQTHELSSDTSGIVEMFVESDGGDAWKPMDYYSPLGNRDWIKEHISEVICRQLGHSGGFMQSSSIPDTNLYDSTEYQNLEELLCAGSEAKLLDCRYGRRRIDTLPDNSRAMGVRCDDSTSNSTATGVLRIDGETYVGATLAAIHSGVTDADGKPSDEDSFTHLWIRVDTRQNPILGITSILGNLGHATGPNDFTYISGAGNSTYVLTAQDEGYYIRAQVNFTDNAGNGEILYSFPEGHVSPVADATLRLAESNTPEGAPAKRVEIYNGEDKEWQSICDDGWGSEEANVACKELGYAKGGTAETRLTGPVSGYELFSVSGGRDYRQSRSLVYMLDDVVCEGTEIKLFDCGHSARGDDNCGDWERAGVSCKEEE